ncbi:hypothetical protein I5G60_gp33 [Mycobacterium phage Saguaro]|uniref:Uncharacterized protein n=1 Tax=Mycobacterium phage Saguaro TaxID=2315616 RepID=A0A386K9E9_9CAUD|nr:hypothetical protein I5G60_gp33 [Mycobacterium phage Saguaro]AYD82028.1 hypothetical protein SEA_SAGUARO_33 [Mycobacterium phage Saguaro]
MPLHFTRQQILEEADRYLFEASKLPDSDPHKQQWIQAASNLTNVVLARVYHQLAKTHYDIPDTV